MEQANTYASSSAYTPEERKAIHHKSKKNLLKLGLFSITMMFAGFTSYYVVSMAKGWISIELPYAFWLSSAAILLSSFTLVMAQNQVKNGKNKAGSLWIFLTLALGLVFGWAQFMGWGSLVDNGIFLAGKTFSPNAGMIYILSGVHLLHVVGGFITLAVTGFRASANKYSPENYLGMELCSIYWHFLGALWIYIFLFLTIFK